MTTIVAAFQVTTPMFLGGADGRSAELRTASFKGVLRFWWRACAWSYFDGDLERVRKEEDQVFGGPNAGQSQVTIRFTNPPIATRRLEANRIRRLGARYLSYGMAQNGRDAVPQGFELAVRLRARNRDAPLPLLLEALQALGTVGGLGARSRRGYGSLSLRSIDDGPAPALRTLLASLLPPGPPSLPPYTAFSPHTRIIVGPAGQAMDVHNRLGELYQSFRKSLQGDKTRVRSGRGHPERISFGLPMHLQQETLRPAGEVDRRASPVFFHIHGSEDDATPVVAFVPARFLPDGVEVDLGTRREPPAPADVLYTPVHTFLDWLVSEHGFEPVRHT